MKKVTIYTMQGNVFRFTNCELVGDAYYIRIRRGNELTSFPAANVERAIFQEN